MTATVRYLYAVTRGLDPALVDAHVALGDAPVRLLEVDGLQAVLSDVPFDEFNESALRQNLEQLPWVEHVARAHDDVVRLIADAGTVVPLRLVTLFTDDAGVRAAIAEWRPQIEEALDRVAGRREWSVKGFLRSDPEVDATTGGSPPKEGGGSAPGAGAAYLARKRALVEDRKRTDIEAVELAEAIHIGLGGHAVATRLLQAQDPQLSGRAERNILNGAYLVTEDEADEFLAGVAALRERYPAVDLVVAGPWAPYSFATLERPT